MSRPTHSGRHTPKKSRQPELPPAAVGRLRPSVGQSDESKSATPATGRYTPPKTHGPSVRVRPASHRVVAIALLVLGLAIIVLNDVMRFTSATLLPGGHNELYLVLGVGVCAWSGFYFGIFDRPS